MPRAGDVRRPRRAPGPAAGRPNSTRRTSALTRRSRSAGTSGHRNAIASVGGRLNPTGRYAVDWLQLDPTVPRAYSVIGFPATP